MSLFPSFFCTISAFSLDYMESTSYVFSFRMVFFYLLTTGWVYDTSLCENSTKKKTLKAYVTAATCVCHSATYWSQSLMNKKRERKKTAWKKERKTNSNSLRSIVCRLGEKEFARGLQGI